MIIKRVGPLSCAKISGTLYGIMGLVVGAVISAVAVAGGFGPGSDDTDANVARVIGPAAIIVMPLLYGCMGFVVTLIAAWIYNVLAAVVGGIEIDVQ
jgi:hypothetical protein